MPTPTDQQLAEDIHDVAENLAGFRVEVAEKFGETNARMQTLHGEASANLAEKLAAVMSAQGTFRAEVETNLKFIRWLGVFFASLLVSLFIGALTVAWNASSLNSDVKYQNRYLDDVRVEVKEQGADEANRSADGTDRRTNGEDRGADGRDGETTGSADPTRRAEGGGLIRPPPRACFRG